MIILNNMKKRLYIGLKNSTKLKLSVKARLIIISSSFAFAAFVILFIFYNTGIHKNGKASTNTELIKNYKKTNNQKKMTDYLMGGNATLEFNNKLSVAAWVKWDTIPQNKSIRTTIIAKNSIFCPEFGQFWLRYNCLSQEFEFTVSTATEKKSVSSPTQLKEGKWYHVAGIYDGTKIYLYVNGELENTAYLCGNLLNFWSFYYLTSSEENEVIDVDAKFSGEIDGISIWNTNLTAEQIQNVMRKKIDPAIQTSLIGYWVSSEKQASVEKNLAIAVQPHTFVCLNNLSHTLEGGSCYEKSIHNTENH